MAKTYEALKKAEEEKRRRQEKKPERPEGPPPEDQASESGESVRRPSGLRAAIPAPGPPTRDVGRIVVDRGLWTVDREPIKLSPHTIEECHRMKYRILESDPERKIRSILFCSPRRKEGCSTVLIHFAISLVSGGERVIMVDGNLRSPYLHKPFHLNMQDGLSDLVLGERQLGEIMKDTAYPNLRIVTSGAPYSNPFQIIESPIFYAHLEEMKTQADWVLLDSSPVSSFMDPVAMAGRVDRVIIVIRAEKTRWEVALDAKRKLEDGNGKILGVVLNDRRYHVPRWLYKRL